jgi:adenine/guanine phosphoribosyltransferase-like PRPP-binding protein
LRDDYQVPENKKNIVFEIVAHLEYERPPKCVPPQWNCNGEAYEAIYLAMGRDKSWDKIKIDLKSDSNLENIRQIIGNINPDSLTAFSEITPILDFSNYRLEVNIFDSLVPALVKLTEKAKDLIILLLPSGYLTSIISSQKLQVLKSHADASKCVFCFVDPDGSLYKISKDNNHELMDRIKALSLLADFPTPDGFRKLLIKKSQRWFGHYRLQSGAHVRTHYDCYNRILKDDFLYKYVSKNAQEFIDQTKPDTIVGFGLMHDAVAHLTFTIASENSILPTLFSSYDETLNLQPSSRVLLISDVVLTAKSANALADKITKMGAIVIGLICILRFTNSAKTLGNGQPIKDMAEIPRPFYFSKAECPLCACKYPETEVVTLEDFRNRPDRINAYDFWEAVVESRSFNNKHCINNGKHYSYYFDIMKLLDMYGRPIVQQIFHQAKSFIKNAKASAILYPEGDAASYFAHQIADEMFRVSVEKIPVYEISREYLESIQRQSTFKAPEGVDMDKVLNQNVIVADDGCATFKTLAAIEDILRRSHANMLAYFVVLNRSHKSATKEKVRQLKGHFQSFYEWPIAVYQDGETCPECAQVTR